MQPSATVRTKGHRVCYDTTGPSYPTVKLHHAILATALMKLRFKRLRTNSLTLRECSERKRQRKDGCRENEPCLRVSCHPKDPYEFDSPRLTGVTILGLCLSHSVFCSLTSRRGGSTIIGVALSTRLSAVSPTASVAAFLLLPNGLTSISPVSTLRRSASDSAGYTSMPCLISSPRIRNTLSAPAVATAAKGTNLPAMTFALGDRLLRRGTSALRPSATPQDALTARR
jgi:hypothetical protein